MNYDIESITRRNTQIKKFKKITRNLVFILLSVLLYNIFLVGVSNLKDDDSKYIFGYKAYIISTSSMKPNINPGDVVIIKRCNSEDDLKLGSIITFRNGKEVVTHRISEIKKPTYTNEYVTKGDNNNVEDDNKVTYRQIIGEHVITIHFLGKIIMFLKNGFFIIFFIIVLIVMIIQSKKDDERSKIRREKKKIEDRKFKEGSINN